MKAPNVTYLSHLLTFLLGLLTGYVGHRFSLRRERRREFNEVADRLFLAFDAQERDPSPLRRLPTDDMRLVRRHLGWYRRWHYDRAMERYQQATGEGAARP